MLKSISIGEQQLQYSSEDLLKLQKALNLTPSSHEVTHPKRSQSNKEQKTTKKSIAQASPRRYPLKEENKSIFHFGTGSHLGEKPLAFVLLAEVNGDAIGLVTYHFIYPTFLAKPGILLDDLYVKAEHRSHRIGQALMLRLREIGQEKSCGRIDWTVAVSNERGIKFYERIDAKIINKVKLCRLDSQALSK